VVDALENLILAFSRCDFKLWNLKKKTVLYSSLRSIAKSQKEKNVTLFRSIALCCAPLLSCSIAQEVGSWKSRTMNGNLTFPLLTNWINHFFFNTKHRFCRSIHSNPNARWKIPPLCSWLRSFWARFLFYSLLSIQFPFSIWIDQKKIMILISAKDTLLILTLDGSLICGISTDDVSKSVNENSDSMDENTMSQGIHEVSPDKGHTLPILKNLISTLKFR